MSYTHLSLDDQIAQTEAAIKELEIKAFQERLNQRMNGALLLATKSKAEQRSLETAIQKHKNEEGRYNTAAAELRVLLAELAALRPTTTQEEDEEPVPLASARAGKQAREAEKG